MFLENKYTALYFKLTSKPDSCEYTENHHIIPRCMGGDNSKSNMVHLSARKHFICHYLLIKMVHCKSPEFYKLIKGFAMMCNCSNSTQERQLNSRIFEKYKILHAKAMSLSQSGEGNSQFGFAWIFCPYNNESKKIPKNQTNYYENIGWIRGKAPTNGTLHNFDIKYNKNEHNLAVSKTRKLRCTRRVESNRIFYENHFKEFKKSGLSLNAYAKLNPEKTREAYRLAFKKL